MRSPSALSMAAVGICLLAIAYFYGNYLVATQLYEKTALIYEYPYTVSNEAREMRTRLLDMRSFITMVLTFGSKDPDELRQRLQRRYERQEKSIAIIAERSSGPDANAKQLHAAFDALEAAQEKALAYVPGLSEQEVAAYVQEKLYPRYDAVKDRLGVIIAAANSHIKALERESAVTARVSIVGTGLLCLLIIGLVAYADRLARSNNRELAYRDSLCEIITANIDVAYLLYNTQLKRMEFRSANCARVLGLKQNGSDNGLRLLEDILPPQELYHVEEILANRTSAEPTELVFTLLDPATVAPRRMTLRIYPYLEKQKITRFIFAISLTEGVVRAAMCGDPASAGSQPDRNSSSSRA